MYENMLDNWDYTAQLMDDELREQVHAELAPCTEKEFLTRYMELHLEKYNKEFTI